MNRLKRSYTRAKKANEGPREHGAETRYELRNKNRKIELRDQTSTSNITDITEQNSSSSSSDESSLRSSTTSLTSNSSDSSIKSLRNNKQQARTNISISKPYDMLPCVTIAPAPAIPMPTYTLEQDVNYFIQDMKGYLEHHSHLSEQQKINMVQAGIKGPARDVLAGYSNEETNTLRKLFKIIRREFKRKERSVRNLHKLKQEDQEPINLFAARIRRYVKNLGIENQRKFDKTCLEYLKIGVHNHIQSRLYTTKKFSKAVRMAMEVEADKNKNKQRTEIVNTMDEGRHDLVALRKETEALKHQVDEICTAIREHRQQCTASSG